MTDSTKPWPTELRLSKDKKQLTVSFDSGESHEYAAEYLRVCSPSAEVQGHSPDQRVTVGTLATIAERAAAAGARAPAVTVIGDVVRLSPSWTD